MLALGKSASGCSVRVENPEPAAGNHWGYVAAAETQIRVRREQRIFQQVRHIIVGIDWPGGKMIRKNRAVRRKWSGHDFINADASACQGSVDASNEAGAVRSIRSIKQCGLFHRSPKLAGPNNLKHIAHAATKFLLRIGAAANQRSGKQGNGKKG